MGQSIYSTPYNITTLAGGHTGTNDGIGSAARFDAPDGVTVDGAGNIYVADVNNETIRKVTPAGAVTTLAGLAGVHGTNDGTGNAARFFGPISVAVDSATNVFVADYDNCTIRKVTAAGVVTTLAGLAGSPGTNDGTGSAARFNFPAGVAADVAGNVYVADYYNHTIRKVTAAGVVTTLAGLAGSPGGTDGTGSAARFSYPTGVAVDAATNVYVADDEMIRKMTLVGTNWVVTTLAGLAGSYGTNDGMGSSARFWGPWGLAVDAATNVYVADDANRTIRKMTPVGTNWLVTTLAGVARAYAGGADGTGSAASLGGPISVAVGTAGNIYIADNGNDAIRKGYPASPVPVLTLSPPVLSAGQFAFGITGWADMSVDILSSTDCLSWQVVGNYVLTNGMNFYVTPAPSQPAQFFRVRLR